MNRKRKIDGIENIERDSILMASDAAAAAAATAESEDSIDAETLDRDAIPAAASDPYPLGLFSVLPEEVLEKILNKKTVSKASEVALRGACRDFRAMYSRSHVELKWLKKKRDCIMRCCPHDYIRKFREEYDKCSTEENLCEFWWLCAERSEEDRDVLLSTLHIDSCWFEGKVFCGTSCLLRGPPSIYKPVIEHLEKYLKSDDKDVRYVIHYHHTIHVLLLAMGNDPNSSAHTHAMMEYCIV